MFIVLVSGGEESAGHREEGKNEVEVHALCNGRFDTEKVQKNKCEGKMCITV